MNVLKALQDDGATEYAALKEKHGRLLQDIAAVRLEMHRMEDHAMVEGIDLTVPDTQPLKVIAK